MEPLPYWPYCERCHQPFAFDMDEPFAHCRCGTTEWGDPRPASWVPWPGTGLDPEVGFILDAANEGELAAYDYGCEGMMAALSAVLDGIDTGEGVSNYPWEGLRRRVIELVNPKSAVLARRLEVGNLKDHQIAQTVNALAAIAKEYAQAQQLRERIAHVIVPILKGEGFPASIVNAYAPGMSKSEYARRLAQGDPSVAPPTYDGVTNHPEFGRNAQLIDAADKHSDNYAGQDIPANEVRAAINNAFFAGAKFNSTLDWGEVDEELLLILQREGIPGDSIELLSGLRALLRRVSGQ